MTNNPIPKTGPSIGIFTPKTLAPQFKKVYSTEAETNSSKDYTLYLPPLTKHAHSQDVRNVVANGCAKIVNDIKGIDDLSQRLDNANNYHLDDIQDDNFKKQAIKDNLQLKYSLYDSSPERGVKKPSISESPEPFLTHSPKKKENRKSSRTALLKLVKGASTNSPKDKSPPGTNASLLQRFHAEEIELKKLHSKMSPTSKGGDKLLPFSPTKKGMKWQAYDYLHNFEYYVGSNMSTLGPLGSEFNEDIDDSLLFGNKAYLSKSLNPTKKAVALPYVYEHSIGDEILTTESQVAHKKPKTDPFDELVKYRDSKMPFYLALNAETRQKMIEEIKKKANERSDINSIIEFTEKRIPEAKAKVINKLTDVENKKKEQDLKSRGVNRNALYQLYALNKNAQRKIKNKLGQQLGDASRFLNL